MTRQTLPVLFLCALALSGCNTLNFDDAEPEKFMGLDCEQLDLLAESYRPSAQEQIFADVSDFERRNAGDRNFELRNNPRPYELDQARDRRSIALARREKGCV